MTYHLFSEFTKQAAKRHRCIWCGEYIEKGEIHIKERSTYDGHFQNFRWHQECLDAFNSDFNDYGDRDFMQWSNERPIK